VLLLAIDTCTERLIVGLRSGPDLDRWTNLDSQGNHARDLLSAVEDLIGTRRPDAIGVAVGPGSFTGVRIGLASAKGLAEGWGVPLIGIDNLAAMADAWTRLVPGSVGAVLPVIDARKKKFYGMLCSESKLLVPASDLAPEAWVEAVGRVWQGPVVLSGYQGRLLADALGPGLPPNWSVLPVHDWTPGLLDQVEQGWADKNFLSAVAGPRYLRLSEAEENLRARST
jgi:tRNA threonylcarbamoyl adenosine modification protein YeaZ